MIDLSSLRQPVAPPLVGVNPLSAFTSPPRWFDVVHFLGDLAALLSSESLFWLFYIWGLYCPVIWSVGGL